MSQTEQILQMLKRGPVTPMDAPKQATPTELKRYKSNGAKMPSPPPADLYGRKVHFLTVIGPTKMRKGSDVLWESLCVCGNKTLTPRWYLENGKKKSCGCMTKKLISESRTRHGETYSPTWNTWSSMMERCYNKIHKSYADYGGRGITVCARWSVYENFKQDMGERPKGTTLDRIDNTGNYEPENCKWSTPKEQARNRRNTRRISFQGKEMLMDEWSKVTGLPVTTISKRLTEGWSVEDALTRKRRNQPLHQKKTLEKQQQELA